MATKKVKKFGRGGDIVTGIGAALIGKALYDKYMGKEQDDEYAKKVKAYNDNKPEEKAAPRKDEPVAEEKVETKTDSGRNSNLSPVEQHAAITKRSNVEPSDNTPVDTNAKKPKNQNQNQNQNQNRNRNRNQNQNQNQNQNRNQSQSKASSFTGEGMAGSDTRGGSRPKSVVFKKDTEPKKDNATINKALKAPATDLSVPKGVDLKGTNKTVYGTDTTSVFQRKAAQERADKEAKARREAEAEKRRRNRPSSEEMMTQSLGGGFKRGGAVKKYASGGSVKTAKPTMRSASSRADGIAIRGKTRA